MSAAHQDVLWQLLGSLAVFLGVLATYLRTRTEGRRAESRHVETADKLDKVLNGTAPSTEEEK